MYARATRTRRRNNSKRVKNSAGTKRRLRQQRLKWRQLYQKLQKVPELPDGFINLPDGITRGLSSPVSYDAYKLPNVAYKDIDCSRIKKGVKAGGCRDPTTGKLLALDNPSRYKVFVAGYRNLYDYGRGIAEGHVSRRAHMELYKILRQQQEKAEKQVGRTLRIINHNLDVPVLHFKLE